MSGSNRNESQKAPVSDSEALPIGEPVALANGHLFDNWGTSPVQTLQIYGGATMANHDFQAQLPPAYYQYFADNGSWGGQLSPYATAPAHQPPVTNPYHLTGAPDMFGGGGAHHPGAASNYGLTPFANNVYDYASTWAPSVVAAQPPQHDPRVAAQPVMTAAPPKSVAPPTADFYRTPGYALDNIDMGYGSGARDLERSMAGLSMMGGAPPVQTTVAAPAPAKPLTWADKVRQAPKAADPAAARGTKRMPIGGVAGGGVGVARAKPSAPPPTHHSGGGGSGAAVSWSANRAAAANNLGDGYSLQHHQQARTFASSASGGVVCGGNNWAMVNGQAPSPTEAYVGGAGDSAPEMGGGGDSAPTSNGRPSPPAFDSAVEKLRRETNPRELTLPTKNARFFVIKSYSEDDVHRSIKYGIWCSTEHGNKRLDNAFKAAKGPIYLLFSVNASGHFCGVARMESAVDYDKQSAVWAQDKWKGLFPVKWLYVKDVPNSQLRHIRLENNENKPVTNSRDTQEVPADKGRQVLRLVHQFDHTTSLFDDFGHYEQRQATDGQRKKTSAD